MIGTAALEEYRDRLTTAPAGYCGQGDASSGRRKPIGENVRALVASPEMGQIVLLDFH